MAQCGTCGSNVLDSVAVCPECGMDLVPALNSPSYPASSQPSQPAPIPQAPTAPTLNPATTSGARVTLRRGGSLTDHVFYLGEFAVLGRFDPDTGPVDVDLGSLPEAAYVSRQHAEIWRDSSGHWFVKDLGSGNGTFHCVAGQRQFQKVSGEQPLHNGDEVALGNARFEFRCE